MSQSETTGKRSDGHHSGRGESGRGGTLDLFAREPILVVLYLAVGAAAGGTVLLAGKGMIDSGTVLSVLPVAFGGATWFLHAVAARRAAAAYRDAARSFAEDLRTTVRLVPWLVVLFVPMMGINRALATVPVLGLLTLVLGPYLVVAYPTVAIEGPDGVFSALGVVKRPRLFLLVLFTLLVAVGVLFALLAVADGSGSSAVLTIALVSLGSAVLNVYFARLYLVYDAEIS